MRQLAQTQGVALDFTKTNAQEWNRASALCGEHGVLFERVHLVRHYSDTEPIKKIFATLAGGTQVLAQGRYLGVIREVTDQTVVQMTGEHGMTAVTHDRAKLYGLGGNLGALLAPGAVVVIEYGAAGMGRVHGVEPAPGQAKGPKR
jgi:hypothetical protein